MNGSVNIRKVGLFIALTYAISFIGFFAYIGLGGTWGASLVAPIIYMFVPLVAAVVVQKLIYKQPVMRPLWVSFRLNRWFLVAILIPVVLVFFTIAVSLLVPGVEFTTSTSALLERFEALYTAEQMAQMREQYEAVPIHPFWIGLLSGVILGATVNAVVAFGEELGWRGFMLKELLPLGFWKSSLIIGVVWGLWHFPAISQGHNYPDNRIAGIFMMIVFSVLMSPLFAYVTLKARSVLAAAVLHGVINALGALPLMVIAGGSDLTVGLTGLAGFVVLAGMNLLLWARGDIPALYRQQPMT